MTNEQRTASPDDNRWGAFCPHGVFTVRGANHGPLARLRFAVKDLFDIAGRPTGAGNPDWLASHPVPAQSAWAVERLLAVGADIVGKTITDELAYSLNGENFHYGTPVNPVSPERIPGGSSCGSAVAVAAGLCDFALGTDTAGSIRLPATFCGVWGFRPTHGVVSSAGVVPLAPSYDSVGWLASGAAMLERVGRELLPADVVPASARASTLLMPDDAWALAEPRIAEALKSRVRGVLESFARHASITLARDGLHQWQQVFRVIQGHEVWRTHGEWISATRPTFGPGIRERFQWASTITTQEADAARHERHRITREVCGLLDDAVLCIPTVSYLAPLRGAPTAEEDRTKALRLQSIASLAGVPQVAIPMGVLDGCAIGLSLIGQRGSDRWLLSIANGLSGLAAG